ncbi:endonuclease MutS2 [Rhodohalobacter sulfatireducens]|uniref:Endonuclease MutS2 n=1 Tax=Rhodohalobacter sulfatireducens TaxID=2911366 RepID=A0ABS9KBG3_9BACT|nr:endonuclease MutS2 [Rhodohalobacter sulfatireducens]MCG2588197.1 endonuclease MutS2 [Rhodohalobacter sulfatireducens]
MDSETSIETKKAYQKLGFEAVLEAALKHTYTPYGKEFLHNLSPATDPGTVSKNLSLASEWMKILQSSSNHPLSVIDDVTDILKASRIKESTLPLEDFLIVLENARLGRTLKNFFKENELDLENLSSLSERLVNHQPVEKAIQRVVTDNGELRDDASSELKKIRGKLNRERNRLRDTIHSVMRRVSKKGMTSDEGPTIRSGRMVIPIQAEFKRKVDGFIHDVSSTGQTIYLEPVEALQINNEIRQLESEEQREIERILRELTAEVGKYSDTLERNIPIIAQFDAIHARVKLGLNLEGSIPELSSDGRLNLIRAMNPNLVLKNLSLKDPEPVIPLNLEMNPDELALVITGPNAGGKSVAMRTVGMLNLMLQSGFPIPVQPDSKMPVLNGIYIDIGDDQSIENDLSTFSSRLQWMRNTLQKIKKNSLVLIDEAGSGTDPEEGGALFQAFVEKVIEMGSRVIVTTHHGSLKVFAHEHDKVVNGAMEFNQENLTPTYRFKKGYPGSSYAFEIADRLNLPKEVMKRARELLGEKRDSMGDLLVSLEENMQEFEQLKREYEKRLRSVEKREKDYEEHQKNIKNKRKKILEKAYKDAEEIMKGANQRIEQAVEKVVSEGREDKEKITEARRDILEAKREIKSDKEKVEQEEKPFRSKEKPKVGDYVLIEDSNTSGELVELSGKKATVLVNGMKIKSNLNKLVKTNPPKKEKKSIKTRAYSLSEDTDLSVKPSLDLRGKRGDEAMKELTKYLDNALTRGLSQVEIIHGKGEGILHKLVHEHLEKRPEVKSFEIAPWDSGGSGCTVVHLN